jgi:hypothetical protein
VENQYLPSEYRSADFEPGSNQSTKYPANPNPGARRIIDYDSGFPWDRPLHVPATRISGGMFIGNLNSIQQQGETGEFWR